MSRCVLAALVLCAFAGPAAAQGLGDAARKESERRSRVKGSAKDSNRVYTGDDLRRGAPETDAVPAAATSDPTRPPEREPESRNAPPASPAGVGGAPGAPSESLWRSRARTLADTISRRERDVALADQEATGRAYDGPVNSSGRPNTQHAGAVERAQAARQALEKARKALEDLEEEARRAGVPPGWIR